MPHFIRFAVIGFIGALMVPSLCSAQLIILHENWHGLGGASRLPSVASCRQQQRPVAKHTDRRVSLGPQTTSSGIERGYLPVRVADHRFHPSQPVESSHRSQVAVAVDVAIPPTIAYDVIESPFCEPRLEDTRHVRNKSHPQITLREGPRTERALIPNTMQMPVWKTPFSYGYFGSSGTKHWYRHHGYRDRRTEWSYR